MMCAEYIGFTNKGKDWFERLDADTKAAMVAHVKKCRACRRYTMVRAQEERRGVGRGSGATVTMREMCS